MLLINAKKIKLYFYSDNVIVYTIDTICMPMNRKVPRVLVMWVTMYWP